MDEKLAALLRRRQELQGKQEASPEEYQTMPPDIQSLVRNAALMRSGTNEEIAPTLGHSEDLDQKQQNAYNMARDLVHSDSEEEIDNDPRFKALRNFR